MDLAELQRRVERYVKLDLGPLHDAYRAQGGGDIDGFLAFLGATRSIDPGVLKELHGMAEVETPSIRDPEYRGTRLATWIGLGAPGPGGQPRGPAAAASDPSDVRFRAISRLGEGAMGAVDIARDVYLRRKVALKTVLPEMAGHPEIFGRFLAEMQITAQLEHPNIVPVYALDVSQDGSLGYAMKLVQGKDLDQILEEVRARTEKGEPLGEEHTIEKRLEVFIKVCDALEYAHSKGIVHRDLKPANIMVGRHHEVYLMDWGIARQVGAVGQPLDAGLPRAEPSDPSVKGSGRTQIGQALGTPHYMSPEQAAGKNQELTGQSDQYAMGLILQEIVTLKTAVDGGSIQEVLVKAMMAKRDVPPPGSIAPEIDAIIRRATAKEPKDRYPSIRDLADDVRRYLRGESVRALPEGALRRAGRWLGKHRMATVTLLLGAAGTIGSLIAGQARIEREHARELRVSQMAAESAIQTQLVDRDLTRYEAALSELVGAAQIVLSKLPPGGAPVYFEPSFSSKETAPPDLGASKVYGRDVSVLAPVTALAPGVSPEPLQAILGSLPLLAPPFRTLQLESSGVDFHAMTLPAQRALITDVGVPALRASIGLREGISLSFPGMAGLPPGDPRESAAYKLAESKSGVVWGTPAKVGNESILTASAALHDEQGAFRGVAILEVSLSRLLSKPTDAELDYVQSRTLVGRDGTIKAEDGESVPLAPEVAAAIAAGKSGSIVATVNGRRYRYAFHPLSTLDWYYVAAADEDRMLGSKQKIVNSDPHKAPPRAPPPKVVAASPIPSATPAAVVPEVPHDAGVEDAGLAVAPDAGLPRKLGGPLPKASASASELTMPPNPFEKWKAYERKPKP